MSDSDKVVKGRGRPSGMAHSDRYSAGVKTKVIRVSETIADNIADIFTTFEQIKMLIDFWDDRIETSGSKSSKDKPSPRYEKAVELLTELRSYLA